MKKNYILFVVTIIFFPFSLFADQNLCPDYQAVNTNDRVFNDESFKIWDLWMKPYYMVHDEIVNEEMIGDATLEAKFDRGSAIHADVKEKYVEVFYIGTGFSEWIPLKNGPYSGNYKTNNDGKIFVKLPPSLKEGSYKFKMSLINDPAKDYNYVTDAFGYVTVIKNGAKVVVFDIDETLTLSNFEQFRAYLDEGDTSRIKPRVAADDLVKLYKEKGYHIVYVTARPYWDANISRQWLSQNLGVPHFTLRTRKALTDDTKGYKESLLKQFSRHGASLYRAYGNAKTDAYAFLDAGIAEENVFIIGKYAEDLANERGIQAILDEDLDLGYVEHLEVIRGAGTPDSYCSLPM